MNRLRWLPILCLLPGLLLPTLAAARIKLITLPVRERVEVQLDHTQATLIEEERVVPLVAGVNQVDFSWANTLIDSESLLFRVVDAPFDVRVLAVSYPPGENALVWSVYAAESGSARVRIGYLIGGLERNFHYRAVAAHDESTLTLAQYLRITNTANETYENARINSGYGEPFIKPLGRDETKDVLLVKYPAVPIRKTYTVDPVEFGYLDPAQNKLNVPMHYVLENDSAHRLGTAPLPFGKARIFQDDGKGSTAFIGEDWGRFTPINDEMKLYLGQARDIVVRRVIAKNERKRVKGEVYDYEVTVRYEIENFKDTPVTLSITEHARNLRSELRGPASLDPQWELLPATTLQGPVSDKSDADTLVLTAALPARPAAGETAKVTHELHLVFRNEW